MADTFQMVAKTLGGLEEVLAEELRNLGALNVEPGRRMVSFQGDKAMLYRANLGCRTALRILKPIAEFRASNPDQLYDRVKDLDWSQWLTTNSTFSVDPVVYSDDFTNSRFVTYRVKDAIVDWFQDRFGAGVRPRVRLQDADLTLNVHISDNRVTLAIDSSGESLHKRGYRSASTEAPINEVLAAGIILMSGWRGDSPFVDPMCGSGTFLTEAALIAANIMPGIYRQNFAFERWPDFDRELFEKIYEDDSAERPVTCPIIGADISVHAIEASRRNLKSAGVAKYVELIRRDINDWTEPPAAGVPGVMVTNPPYGQRLKPDDLPELYHTLGNKIKFVFKGYHAWVIGMRDEEFDCIGLTPSVRREVLNGSLECQLREYISFEGDYKSFRAKGGTLERKGSDRRKGSFKKDDGKKSFGKKPYGKKGRDEERRPRPAPEESENPLAKRRNPAALKFLEKLEKPRRGWRKPGDDSQPSDTKLEQ